MKKICKNEVSLASMARIFERLFLTRTDKGGVKFITFF